MPDWGTISALDDTLPASANLRVSPRGFALLASALWYVESRYQWGNVDDTQWDDISAFLSDVLNNTDTATGVTVEYTILRDEQPQGTHGGTFTRNLWVTRTLNTHIGSASNVSLSANQITLQPGTYAVDVAAPANRVDRHECRLYNVTANAPASQGHSLFATNLNPSHNYARLNDVLTISTPTVYRVEHRCDRTWNNTGLGNATNIDRNEIYTVVQIWRLA